MIKFKNNKVEDFHIILSRRDLTHLGQINNIKSESFSVTCNLNSANELTFEVYKEIDGYIEPLWDDIYDLRIIYIIELDEYFEINVTLKDMTYDVKTITGTSLCASELSQTYLFDVEINTETDLKISNYVPTVFYNKDNPSYSLLHRILEKVPAYSIGHVDDSLKRIQRTFSISNSTIYDFLTGECAKEIGCLFKFDTKRRQIDVYDLLTVCLNDECDYYQTSVNKIRYRGKFNDVCPKCGSTNLGFYGNDTTIYVSTENLTDEIELTTDVKSMKNCFRLTAGDDTMTAAVMNVNPNGTRYIYNFNSNTMKDMPVELVDKLKEYNNDFSYYMNEYPITLSDKFEQYNGLLNKYNDTYAEYYKDIGETESKRLTPVSNPIVGHTQLILHIYETNDLYYFLKHTMMPFREQVKITAQTEKEKLESAYDNGDFKTLALSSVSLSTSILTVNSSLVNFAKVFVKSGYVKIEALGEELEMTMNEETNKVTGVWKGAIKITDYSDSENYVTTKNMIISVDNDYDTFMKTKVLKNISLNDDDESTVFNMLQIKDLNLFTNNLKKFCATRIESFRDAIQASLTILADSMQDIEGSTLYDDFYCPYYDKLKACENELAIRNEELDIIAVYQISENETETLTDGFYKELIENNSKIQNQLNLENYLGDRLYQIFTTYRREDSYENSNYISAGFSNSQIINKAIEFYEAAEKELVQSSLYQHTLSSNLYNLLLLEEFQPIVDYFELGNWIRVKIDGKIYRLRLSSYELNYGDLKQLNTEFTDMTQTADGMTDIQSLLSKVSSLAGSYNATMQQASSGYIAKETMDDWFANGLSSSLTTIKNNQNAEIVYDSTGILGRSYNDEINGYDNEQMRLSHNILCYTDDNWESVSTALGKHSYVTYDILSKQFINLTGYGLSAQFVQSGQINGSQIIGGEIYSTNYQLNKQGSYYDLDRGLIYLNGNGENKFKFDGNELTIKGKITATSLTLEEGVQLSASAVDLSGVVKIDQAITSSTSSIQLSSDGSIISKDEKNRKIELSEGRLKIWGNIGEEECLAGTIVATGSAENNIFRDISVLSGLEGESLGFGKVTENHKTDLYYKMNFTDTGYRHNFRDTSRFFGDVKLDGKIKMTYGDTTLLGYPVISDSTWKVQLIWNGSQLEVYVNTTKIGNMALA